MSEIWDLIKWRGTLLKFFQFFTFHSSSPFSTSKSLIFTSTYFYKDERALPGELHTKPYDSRTHSSFLFDRKRAYILGSSVCKFYGENFESIIIIII
jgi:hypothetical protein